VRTIAVILVGAACIGLQAGHAQSSPGSSATHAADSTLKGNPEALFNQGEAALKAGNLDQAERAFQSVIELDPQVAGAYANLGVIYMRRKQWPKALDMLHKAERLAPSVAGIRLNEGLVYYRQNDYRSAIAPFASVVKQVPDSDQARYLLGLCYFFTEQYADATTTLEPLWPRASDQLNYLYVLGIAANKANRPELEQRALGRLVEIGQNSAEYHLFMGKAHLNREEYDDAIKELEAAAKLDPKLPFVHFNLGLSYMKKQDLERAKAEFLADVAVEPDIAENYDQLGVIYSQQQQDQEAEKNFLKALRLNSRLTSSHYELARVYLREQKYQDALKQIEAAEKLAPGNPPIHFVKGQILQKLGRTTEAKAEMATATRISNEQRDKRQKELYEAPTPNPELTQEPQ
jgi:tetratricopeptide (TPR) repeat protein